MEPGTGSRVEHPNFGKGVVVESGTDFLNIWFKSSNSVRSIAKNFEGLRILTAVESQEAGGTVNMADLEFTLHKVLDQRADISDVVPLGNRWIHGSLVLKPFEEGTQSKEIPIETFFHKIVMVRDRLRVLEQQINAHKVLNAEEKINLQQYITRIYGSLTTFNVLFRNPSDQFKGEGKE